MEFEEGDYDENHGLHHFLNVIRETVGFPYDPFPLMWASERSDVYRKVQKA